MARKVIKRNKKLNTFALGGLAGLGTDLSKIGPLGSGGAAGSVGMQATKGLAGGLGSMAGGVGGLLNSGVDMVKGLMNPSGNETGVGNALSTVGSLASNIPGVGGIIGAGVNLVGGLVNSAFGSNINEEFVNETKQKSLEQSNYVSGASDNSTLLNDYASHLNMNDVSKSDVGSDGWFSNKAKKKTEELNKKIDIANQRALMSLDNTASNIDSKNDLNVMANYSAFGGPLDTFDYRTYGRSYNDIRGTLPNSYFEKPSVIDTFKKIDNEYRKKHPRLSNTGKKLLEGATALDPTGISGMFNAASSLGDMDWNNSSSYLPLAGDFLGALPTAGSISKGAKIIKKGLSKVGKNSKLINRATKAGRATTEFTDRELDRALDGMKEGLDNMKPSQFTNNLKKIDMLSDIKRSKTYKYDTAVPYLKGSEFVNTLNEVNSDLDNQYKDGGGIHIKKANRGKFTEYCGGKVTSECIARGKKSSNPTTRKRATFAANARHWNADGGFIGTHGGDFTNGVITIDEGGLHEENPLTGVPMGVDNEGNPNLVEEGEVLFNNYVFSNRLNANENLLNHYKLPSKYKNKTFADMAKDINKESTERPNDPISKRGLTAGMTRLMQAQEDIRTRDEGNTEGTQYAKGGSFINNLGLSDLRYAPAVGSGLNMIGDLTGLTNKPDYSNADMVLNSVGQTPMVQAKPIGNYLTYNPFDRNFYQNKLNAQAGATRRAIQNTAGGNRAAANAGILAADYNYGNNLGNLARQAEEYNLAQRQQVEQFNRGTNQFNSEVSMRADVANQAAIQNTNNMRFNAANTAAQMRESIRDKSSAAKSANLTNFFDNLGAIGQEEFSRNMIESNPSLDYSIDRKGKVKFKNKTKSKKKSKGGYLTYGR